MIGTERAKPAATPEGQARKEEVFRPAARLMVRKGCGAASINDIVKAVGMTKVGLYHHIRNEQNLAFEILQNATDGLDRLVAGQTVDFNWPAILKR